MFSVSPNTTPLGALLAPPSLVSNFKAGVLAVGQESTSGLTRLPGTRLELATIKKHAETIRHLQLEDKDATVDAVLNAMDEYSWVHFACHATRQPDIPTKSTFHQHDGDLVLSAITRRSLKNNGLALLSACQTVTGSKELPDEAVHLAGGMLMAGYPSVVATVWANQDEDSYQHAKQQQGTRSSQMKRCIWRRECWMAGYPSVIATMWGIGDQGAPTVASRVYAELLKGGNIDRKGAAKTLHQAVASLREEVGQNAFERWVPFLHIGIGI